MHLQQDSAATSTEFASSFQGPMKKYLLSLSILACASVVHAEDANKPAPIGYDDTPLIPGSQWRVHDIKRPAPPVITPGQKVGEAPSDAVVIFNGKSTDTLVSKKDGGPCPWKNEDGDLVIYGGDVLTKESFGSCQLHLEFKTSPDQKGNSQKKGNSGAFFMDRYECQILDCYNNPTYADGTVGAVYGQTPPLVNASRAPGNWQSYDIVFTAPKLEKGKVVEPAYVTTFVNGVCVQVHTKIMGPTKHKQTTDYSGEFPEKAPLRLQDHKNDPPVHLRNIWIRPLP
jgi:hypothetical protein